MTSTDPIERSWDLSLYELHRTPQEAITDETEIAVSARSLQSELTCPICGQPTVIKGKEQYGGGYICYKKKGM